MTREAAGRNSFENNNDNQKSMPTPIITTPIAETEVKMNIKRRIIRLILVKSALAIISLTRCKRICPEKEKRGIIINCSVMAVENNPVAVSPNLEKTTSKGTKLVS